MDTPVAPFKQGDLFRIISSNRYGVVDKIKFVTDDDGKIIWKCTEYGPSYNSWITPVWYSSSEIEPVDLSEFKKWVKNILENSPRKINDLIHPIKFHPLVAEILSEYFLEGDPLVYSGPDIRNPRFGAKDIHPAEKVNPFLIERGQWVAFLGNTYGGKVHVSASLEDYYKDITRIAVDRHYLSHPVNDPATRENLCKNCRCHLASF